MKKLILAILMGLAATITTPVYSCGEDITGNQTKAEVYKQGYIDAARYDEHDPPSDKFKQDYGQGYRDGANRYQPDLPCR